MKIVASIKERWVVWIWQHTSHCLEILRQAAPMSEPPLSFRPQLKICKDFSVRPTNAYCKATIMSGCRRRFAI
jgi:hypothetical protein